jgi:hypothetical protein
MDVDHGKEGALLEIGDDDLLDLRSELLEHQAQEIVGHGARGLDPFNLEGDGVRLEHADPDRQEELALGVPEDDNGNVGRGVQHQTADLDS